MRLLSVSRSLFIFFLIFEMARASQARERGPRVEVGCPSPPVAVKLGEHRVLAYELHVTNFDIVPLTLKRVEVFSDANRSAALKELANEVLSGAMVEAGAMGGSKDPQVIGPAKRSVVFIWLELGLDTALPRSLLHRMVFDARAGAEGAATESTLENLAVPVRQEAALPLSPPFDGGVWLAGDGPGNDSNHRRSLVALDGQVHDAQRFASDWVKVGANGDSHHDGTSSNEDWWGYGEPILAVADGEVTQMLDGIPDNTPRVLPKKVTLDNIVGNYVVLRVATNRYVTYAHLKTGSIKVQLHDHVRRGTVLGRLGNSGQATAPHLHLQVTDGNSVLQSEGVPFIFSKFTDLGPGSAYELDKHSSIPRTDSLPGQDEVVEFTAVRKQ